MKINLIVFIYGLIVIDVILSLDKNRVSRVRRACQRHTKKVFNGIHNHVQLWGWHPSVIFDKARKFLGKGRSGKVKETNYLYDKVIHKRGQENLTSDQVLAIKKVAYDSVTRKFALMELEVLYALSKLNQRSWFYGCAYKESRYVYIVLKKMESGLNGSIGNSIGFLKTCSNMSV